jgi:hypothetical protein
VVDVARPESIKAREFAELVDAFVSGSIKPGMEAQIRSALSHWRDNDEKLQRVATQSSIVQEVAPLSQSLSSISAAGLQALDFMDRGEKAPKEWETQQLAAMQQAFQPKGQVMLMVVPSVQKLIQASAGNTPTTLSIPKAGND